MSSQPSYGATAAGGKQAASPPVASPRSAPKVAKAYLITLVVAFVACGTLSTIMSKILFQMKGVGLNDDVHFFQKPLLQNAGMFLGMTCCLAIHFVSKVYLTQSAARAATTETRVLLPNAQPPQPTSKSIYYLILLPAFCDFAATYAMNIGLLFINASIWQMIRGSIVFFSAMLRWLWLKRKIYNYQWFGVFIVMSALCIIGWACIESSDDVLNSSTVNEKIAGVLLVLMAQLIQATQTVVEEHLLHDVNAEVLMVVGLEGIWGLVLCIAVAMPVAQALTIGGLHEDTWDSLAMLHNNPQIASIYTGYVVVILIYNYVGLNITQCVNSVTRNILDTLRTIFIWIILTVVHYSVNNKFGETWNTQWSVVQLIGFGVLVTGLFTYYRVVELPFFDYDEAKEEELNPQHEHDALDPTPKTARNQGIQAATIVGRSPRI